MSNSIESRYVREVSVCIHASVSSTVKLEERETLQDLKNRHVDICLHGAGALGHKDKEDLGADDCGITAGDNETMVLVNKGLLLALIDTAERLTDLEAVYDDTRGTHYNWNSIEKLVVGLDLPVRKLK